MIPAGVAAIAITTATLGADRLVIGEYFTATWCDSCKIAGPIVDSLIDEYDEEIAILEYHYQDEYALDWGNARLLFYTDLPGVPRLQVDGVVNAGAWDFYETRLLERMSVPTDVKIDLDIEQLDDDTFKINGYVCMDTDGQQRVVRVYMVQALDHWPPDPAYGRNTLKQVADTTDLLLKPGQCLYTSAEFTVDSDSLNHPEDIKFMAWLQEPSNVGPAEIYNGAVVAPLAAEPCPSDVNDDEIVNVDDLFGVINAWGACDDCPEDVNDDGVVTVGDLFAVINAWGPCP
jgi:hypothetical protein